LDALSIAAVAMQNDLSRLNSISRNLANVVTPGYKREIPVSRMFADHVEDAAGGSRNLASAMAAIDPSAGTLRETGNPLDLAIEGDGYFEVATSTGLVYTRQGRMRVDTSGRFVTEQGFPLTGVGGEISVAGTSVTIDRDGQVKQGDRIAGRLKLVRFANPGELTPLGNGLFGQGGARIADTEATGMVRAGYQENSNVNSAQEMVKLSETVRHFEAMQKVMQGYDDAFERAIHKLGDF